MATPGRNPRTPNTSGVCLLTLLVINDTSFSLNYSLCSRRYIYPGS